jgi:tetracycline resistance efflux pump
LFKPGRAQTIEPSWTSVIPPVLAIVLAVATRQVYLSLGAGVWLGWTILSGWHPLAGLAAAVEGCVAVLADAGNARMLLFMLVIGALIATVEASGGVRGFVNALERRDRINTPRRVRLLTYLVGLVVFIESTITILVCGAIGRPLCDRHRVSREKLAYLVDSTSAPVCMLIPLNAWGAYVLGILASLGVENPLGVFVASVPFNFYAWGALILAGIVAFTGWSIGPMKKADARTQAGDLLWPGATPVVDPDVIAPPVDTTIPPRAVNMLVPVAVMVLLMPVFLFVTGDGDLRKGSGSTSVLWAVLAALAVAWVMLLAQRAFTIERLTRIGIKGAGGLVGLALLMLLALALAAVANKLGTGAYVAGRVPAAGVRRGVRRGVLHRHELGHVRDHAADRRAGGRRAEPAAGAVRGRGPLGRGVRRPRLADQRHDDHLLHGRRHRPRRPRPHAAPLRAAGRRGRGGGVRGRRGLCITAVQCAARMADALAQPSGQHDSSREVPPEYDVFCEGCGYSLAGNVADRCPECGDPYDPAALPFARVPWLHRRRLGPIRAYLSTVRMITFSPRRFARELCRPTRISAEDARKFRRVTLRIAAASFVVALASVVVLDMWDAWAFRSLARNLVTAIALVLYAVAFAVFLALATDMPVFVWKTLPTLRPHQLAPIHHYAAAPLAFMPLVALGAIAAAAGARTLKAQVDDVGMAALLIGLSAVFLAVWVVPVLLMRFATGCGARRILALLLYLPVHFAMMLLVASLGFAVVMSVVEPLLRNALP